MLITISGPSTIGKDSSWLKIAEQLGYKKLLPFTSRKKREGEIEGRNHFYISTEEFQRLIKDKKLMEWDFIMGNYYGTSKEYENKIISNESIVIDILSKMAIRLKHRLPNIITILLLTSDKNTLGGRLIKRGYEGEELRQRTNHCADEEAHAALFDHVIPDADILTKQQVAQILLNITSSINY